MLTNANKKHLIDAVPGCLSAITAQCINVFVPLIENKCNKWQIAVIFTADAPKSSRHKFSYYYFMKSSSFKLLDGKWAEWEEQEAENRCDKGQQELQEQTILHVQRRGNITNQRATLGSDSVFFLIFHLRSGWSCRARLCCTLTQVTDSCNDRVTQPERAPPPRGTATPMLQRIFHPGCVLRGACLCSFPFPIISNVHSDIWKPVGLQKHIYIYFPPLSSCIWEQSGCVIPRNRALCALRDG